MSVQVVGAIGDLWYNTLCLVSATTVSETAVDGEAMKFFDRKEKIDIIAESEIDSRSIVCEVKRERSRIDLNALKAKFAAFANAVGGRWKRAKPEFLALSTEEM